MHTLTRTHTHTYNIRDISHFAIKAFIFPNYLWHLIIMSMQFTTFFFLLKIIPVKRNCLHSIGIINEFSKQYRFFESNCSTYLQFFFINSFFCFFILIIGRFNPNPTANPTRDKSGRRILVIITTDIQPVNQHHQTEVEQN